MFSKEPGGRTGYIYRSSKFPHALIAIPYFPAFPTTGWLIHNPHFSPLSASDFLLQHRRARVCSRRHPCLQPPVISSFLINRRLQRLSNSTPRRPFGSILKRPACSLHSPTFARAGCRVFNQMCPPPPSSVSSYGSLPARRPPVLRRRISLYRF